MSDFSFRVSPNIILGTFSSSRLGQFAKEYGERFMVIIDPVLKECGVSEKILSALNERQVDYFVFDEIGETNDSKTLEIALNLAKESHAQGVIACGGVKTINLSRSLCGIFYSEKTIHDIIDSENETLKGKSLPLICLPTTNRDPFLFTNRIPIVDSRSKKIKVLKCQYDIVKQVVFDPNMNATLTENQTSAITLEILCHAIETFSSQKATFFSDMLIEKATEVLGYAIDGSDSLTITTPKEVLISQAGCLVSLASGTSSLGAASLLALAINGRFGISHSLVTAILLPYVIEDIAKFKSEKLAKISALLKILPPNEDASEEKSAAKEIKFLADNIRNRLTKANLPVRLKDLGISVEQLALAAEDAGELDLMNSLPRSMTADDLFAMIKAAF